MDIFTSFSGVPFLGWCERSTIRNRTAPHVRGTLQNMEPQRPEETPEPKTQVGLHLQECEPVLQIQFTPGSPSSALSHPFLGRVPLLKKTTEKGYPYSRPGSSTPRLRELSPRGRAGAPLPGPASKKPWLTALSSTCSSCTPWSPSSFAVFVMCRLRGAYPLGDAFVAGPLHPGGILAFGSVPASRHPLSFGVKVLLALFVVRLRPL